MPDEWEQAHGKCSAYLTVAGRDYECDRDDPPHRGLAHTNAQAEALWGVARRTAVDSARAVGGGELTDE